MFVLLCFVLVITPCELLPNFVVVLTDDQDLLLRSLDFMGNTTKLVANYGMTFTNFFVNTPICCPSRSTVLTGKYPHNIGVFNNGIGGGCSSLNWQNHHENATIAAALKSEKNYRTFYAGKYLNQYGTKEAGGVGHVPFGYDWWLGLQGNSVYYNYTLSVNGSGEFFENDYLTDKITQNALDFLNQKSVVSGNFFMMLAPPACHAPFTPAPRHRDEFPGLQTVRNVPFNATPTNKHWLVEMPPLHLPTNVTVLDDIYANRIRTLLAVDEMVGRIVDKLEEIGALEDTYLIVTSDNGFHIGQFTQPWDKRQPYESDIRVPFIVRGPKIPRKVVSDYPVSAVDFASTILDLAGIKMADTDGESFKKQLFSENSQDYDKYVLIEYWGVGAADSVSPQCPWEPRNELDWCVPENWCKCQDSTNNTYSCFLRVSKSETFKFCAFAGGFIEAYNLIDDPHELNNLILSQSQVAGYLAILERLRYCEGRDCMAVLEMSVTSKTRENMKKTPKNDKKQVKKVLLVAQELKLARVLAGNNKTSRDRALKSLKKWFQNRSTAIPFSEGDFLRLWKGLFYSMWMSDKPLVQEECAENISSLVHALPLSGALLFFKCGMTILMNEWFGIDQLRLDKFLMFVRRLLRQSLFVLKNENWSQESVRKYTEALSETILNTQKQRPMGLLMHFIEIYLEELAKVSTGALPPYLMTDFLRPFIKELAFSDDPRIIDHIRRHVFVYLIRQSDLGLEYQEKYQAWRNLGFPGSIDSMKKVEVSDEEEEEAEEEEETNVYDPRAGRVNVNLSQLKFHSKAIAKALTECKFAKATNSKSRKCLGDLAEHFKKMASGIYPLGVKKIKLATDEYDMSIRKAVNRLVKFDQKIKGKKHKKRKLQNDEIELRGGKKIKLNEKLQEKIANELNHVMNPERRKKKRKIAETPDSPPQKQMRQEETPLLEVESVFKRNSGMWFVTKQIEDEPQEKTLFPKSQWEDSNNKNIEKIEQSLKNNQSLIKNPFATSNWTPVKKVKINTKLNRSQDVDEHHAQIKSSPAIPYDANKKPSKPLLKTPMMQSPINPFYTI
ncbi:Nop52, Sulfatase, Phosphodiest and/or Metalloenzyme domain containing protein [Asbolus verrucosus]|uniref:Nop52, Sulfatase, Phosphodiest and/or Metalloenzyme domain containing protein n=1 Tax=Asbolus verrucosus TaxID=1661398 RepID=A0A482WD16_ASBVE|nr:Nop52, Sulfatase, Phosphodiest and/or Metalloenzyme domain containing protein [Asbolus verrucosus]